MPQKSVLDKAKEEERNLEENEGDLGVLGLAQEEQEGRRRAFWAPTMVVMEAMEKSGGGEIGAEKGS